MQGMVDKSIFLRLQQEELNGAALYKRVAEMTKDPGELDLPMHNARIVFFAVERGDGDTLRQKLQSFYEEWWRPRHARLKLLPAAISVIDRTVRKGTIHKNTGSRYKSRLLGMVNKSAK